MLALFSVYETTAQEYVIRRDTIKEEIVTFEDKRTDAQEDIKFFFRINSFKFEEDFSSNPQQISRLDQMMSRSDVTVGLDSLVLAATASIDGSESFNETLAKNRANSVKSFLTDRYPLMKSDLLNTRYFAEDWEGLRKLVAEDSNVPYQQEVLKVIDDKRRSNDNREWVLKTLRGGKPWEYLKVHILPKLRYGASVVFYYNVETLRKLSYKNTIITDTVRIKPEVLPVDTAKVVAPPVIAEPESNYRPIALKTNLLYDALLTVNAEVEIPIGKRWSVGAEYIFPWWSSNKNNYTQRIQVGHLSATYWLGDRESRDYLTGWNVGLFGGYGDYDIQLWDSRGQQATVINTGLSIGYAHAIAKNLHLHYQLGFGYAQMDFRAYHKMWDTRYGDVKVFDYPWETKRRTWIGPTQAEISLVWMLNLGKKK